MTSSFLFLPPCLHCKNVPCLTHLLIGLIKAEWPITREERIGRTFGQREARKKEPRYRNFTKQTQQVRHAMLRKVKEPSGRMQVKNDGLIKLQELLGNKPKLNTKLP